MKLSKVAPVCATVLITVSVAVGLVACASDSAIVTPTASSPAPSPVLTPSDGIVAPTVIDVRDLPGTTVTLARGDFLDINVEESNAAAWSAEATPENIVEFIPGGPNGDAVDNPGFAALDLGTTTVMMTDGTTIVEFTIVVVAD